MYTRLELKTRWKENAKEPNNLTKFQQWVKKDFNVEWNSDKGYLYTPKTYAPEYCVDTECKGCDLPRKPGLLVIETAYGPKTVSLGCKPTACIHDEIQYPVNCVIQEQKENPMYAQISTGENQEREYLRKRLREVKHEKEGALPAAFNINGLDSPKTVGQLKEYLAKGFLVIDPAYEKMADDHGIYSPKSALVWRDPSKPADRAGYENAYKALDKAYTEAKDEIMVKDANAGLEALKAFEAKTFH